MAHSAEKGIAGKGLITIALIVVAAIVVAIYWKAVSDQDEAIKQHHEARVPVADIIGELSGNKTGCDGNRLRRGQYDYSCLSI